MVRRRDERAPRPTAHDEAPRAVDRVHDPQPRSLVREPGLLAQEAVIWPSTRATRSSSASSTATSVAVTGDPSCLAVNATASPVKAARVKASALSAIRSASARSSPSARTREVCSMATSRVREVSGDELTDRLGIELPIVQAPMAGASGVAMAVAVARAGGLGSLPSAMLTSEQLAGQIDEFRHATEAPLNVNFFCHEEPQVSRDEFDEWSRALSRFDDELGVDRADAPAGAPRIAFDEDACQLVERSRPEVVSFHFGLPAPELVDRVRATGATVMASATTVAEAIWLESHGCDVVIAQGAEAGGHRGMFLTADVAAQPGTMALVPRVDRRRHGAGDRGRWHRRWSQRRRCARARRVCGADRHCLPAVPGGADLPRAPSRPRGNVRRHGADQRVHRAPGAWSTQPDRRRTRSDLVGRPRLSHRERRVAPLRAAAEATGPATSRRSGQVRQASWSVTFPQVSSRASSSPARVECSHLRHRRLGDRARPEALPRAVDAEGRLPDDLRQGQQARRS